MQQCNNYSNILKTLQEGAEIHDSVVKEIFTAIGLARGRFTKETIKFQQINQTINRFKQIIINHNDRDIAIFLAVDSFEIYDD